MTVKRLDMQNIKCSKMLAITIFIIKYGTNLTIHYREMVGLIILFLSDRPLGSYFYVSSKSI